MRLVGTKLAFGNRWIQVYAKRYKFANGNEDDFFVVGKESQVAAVFAIENGELLLVKQYRWAVDSETIDIPGGSVEEGETAIKAAQRELAEETGYEAKDWELLCSRYLDSGQKDCIQHIFLAQKLNKINGHGGETGINVTKRPIKELWAALDDVSDGPIESTVAVALAAYYSRFGTTTRPA